ncbi:MAG: TolC family protein [Breznakibacter sp.]
MRFNKLRYGFGVLFSIAVVSSIYGQRMLTLDQSLAIANQMSPTIRAARLSLEQNQENLNAQRAALKSKFSLNVTPIAYSNQREYDERLGWSTNETTSSGGRFTVEQPILATDGTVTLTNNLGWQDSYSTYNANAFKGFSNTLSLGVDQPIFTYNRTKMTIRRLEYSLENSKLNYELRLLAVEKSVTQAFYEVYQAQKSLETAREEYENRMQSYEIIKNKVDAGLVAKEELFQAELDMLSSKSSVQDDEVSLENSLDNFKQLLGLPLDDAITVLAEVSVTPVSIDLKQSIERGLASRMELRQREIEIEQGQFDLITTKAENEFYGNIGLSYGISGDDVKLKNVYKDPSKNQNVQVTFSIPIFDWGANKAKMRAQQAAQNSLELDLENERIDIALSIRQVYRNLANYLNQIDIARKNEENAQLTYDINLEKYKNGDLTSMDLNLVQNQLTQKKQSLTNALIQYKLELLNMKIQTLYDYENSRNIVPDFSKKK